MSDTKPKPTPDDGPDKSPGGERIAKRLARAGLCSRREAERWIAAGRVSVDGKKLDTPAVTVTAASRILVDGKPLPDAEPAALWRYHKPAGLVTTNRDPQGRPTIFDALPAGLPRVITVGRLDLTTEGLLLLTNDGALARHLELPSTGWSRRYRVRVHGKVDPDALKALGVGVTISGVHYGPITARLDRTQGANAWLTFVIREGKNREIRRVCEHLGLTVNRLIRVGYGPFELGELEPGAVARVPARALRDQLGKVLPDVDFGSGDARPQASGARPQARGDKAQTRGDKARPGPKGQRPNKGKPGPAAKGAAKGRPFRGGTLWAKTGDAEAETPAGRPLRDKGPGRGRPAGNRAAAAARGQDAGATTQRSGKPGKQARRRARTGRPPTQG